MCSKYFEQRTATPNASLLKTLKLASHIYSEPYIYYIHLNVHKTTHKQIQTHISTVGSCNFVTFFTIYHQTNGISYRISQSHYKYIVI